MNLESISKIPKFSTSAIQEIDFLQKNAKKDCFRAVNGII